MKRFLLLFCAVVLVCSIMVVPAFAAPICDAFSEEAGVWAFEPVGDLLPKYFARAYYQDDFAFEFWLVTPTENNVNGDITYEQFLPGVDRVELTTGIYDDDPLVYICGSVFYSDGSNGDFFVDYPVTRIEIYSEPPEDLEPEPISPIDGVLGIFSGISTWIINQLAASTSLFWDAAAGSLTFLGILAVASLAFSVILLLIVIIRRFLHFRG